MSESPKIAYFGGEPLGVPVLHELEKSGITPELIICNPDRPSGRGQRLAPPPVKVWAGEHSIETFQPGSFDESADLEHLTCETWDLFVVVAYNHILPKWLIEIPKYGTINLHPSLLPKLRGPSPIRTSIVEDKPEEVGVSIMLMDEEMDHGPLLAQRQYVFKEGQWPMRADTLESELAKLGAGQLLTVIPLWLGGELEPTPQAHSDATYTKKLTKELGELQIDPHKLPQENAAKQMLQKVKGLAGWPGTFFYYRDLRIKVTDAELKEDGTFSPITVIPAGKQEMSFVDWLGTLER